MLGRDGETSTRISLDLVGATQGPFRYAGARLAQNGAIRRLYLILPATAAATAANIGRIGAGMDRIAEADQRRKRENIERAYREEAAGISR